MIPTLARVKPLAHFFACLSLGLMGACASTTSVAFRVEHGNPPRPVHAAHLRVIPLERGFVPLPINQDTIDEILTGELNNGVMTNERGEARLTIASHVPHLVEVLPPPLGPDAGSMPLRTVWSLNAGGTSLSNSPLTVVGEGTPPRLSLSPSK